MDGSAVPSIKALRALIISGRHVWFERAATLAPGDDVTAMDAPITERDYLLKLGGSGARLRKFKLEDAEIWMLIEPGGWRVAAVVVRDASALELNEAVQVAAAARGGCLTIAAAVVVPALVISMLS